MGDQRLGCWLGMLTCLAGLSGCAHNPIFYAAAEGNAGELKTLIDQGADVNTASSGGHETPLYLAAKAGSEESVVLLLGKGARPDIRNVVGETPMHVAVSAGNAGIVAALAKAGADPNAEDDSRETPLLRAVTWRDIRGRLGIVEALLAAKANPDARLAITPDMIDIQKKLLQMSGKDEKQIASDIAAMREKEGATPLILACMNSGLAGLAGHELEAKKARLAIAETLAAGGADVNAATVIGATAIMYAVDSGRFDLVGLLIGKGADVNRASRDGRTPLIQAAIQGNRQCTDLLLKAGADVKAADGDGNTALHHAVHGSCRSAAEKLLAAGAPSNVKNKAGKLPADYAQDDLKDLF